MIRRSLSCLLTAAAVTAISGCASKKESRQAFLWAPEPIAVLPLNNMTNDLQGPEIIRHLMQNRVNLSFGTVSLEEMDEKLRLLGISDGGQLKAVRPEKLGEELNAHGLLYGELLEFKNVNLGVYHSRTVKARFWLVNAKTGEKIWENSQKVSNKRVAASKEEAAEILVEGYAEKMGEMIAKSPLKEESQETVELLTASLETKFGRSMLRGRRRSQKNKKNRMPPKELKKAIDKWMNR